MPTSLTGATPRDYSQAYGGIPEVPDPFESLRTTLTGNLGNLGDLYKLALGGSAASAAGAMEQLRQNMPLTPELLGQRSQNILANLQGLLSTGLTNKLAQTSAERFGAPRGFGADSPALSAAYLAATGRSVEDIQKLGQEQLATAIQTTPMGPQFNPMQFMVSPGDFQNWQMYANMLRAAPVPSSAAEAEQRALRQGLTAGGGAVPYAGRSGVPSLTTTHQTPWGSMGPSTIVAPSLGTGTYYGGQLYPAGTSPTTEANNWYNWIAGLSTSPTAGGGGTTYMGSLTGWPDAGTGGGFTYMGNPQDFYDLYGFTPEEWGSVGGTWEGLGTTGGGWSDIFPDVSPDTWETFGLEPWDVWP